MLDPNIITALVTGSFSLVVAGISIIASSRASVAKDKNHAELVGYKLDELKKDVEKHNQIVERTYHLESEVDSIQKDVDARFNTVWKRYDDINTRVDRIETR